MKKFFIITLSSLFIIAIVIRQCSGDDSYDEEDDEEVTETIDSALPEKSATSDFDEKILSDTIPAETESQSEKEEKVSANYDTTSLEIPKLISSKPSQILVREGYTTSYNNKTKNANWVAWHLTSAHTDGNWSRDGIPYMVDEDVKGARQELEDWYNNSLPIDHGHMCPAGDNKWSAKAMEQTFLLTNMCPQNSELNRGDWEELESRCRGWARHYGDVYIVCGPIFYTSKYKTIGYNKVGVPDAFYKVVLCMTKKPKALGFIYPNNSESHRIQFYVTTVDKVEAVTGIDFFCNLPDDVENAIESVANFNKW